MTVSTTTNKVSYSGTGSQTVFAYTFKIFADGDLDVYIRDTNGTETLQTITTNYTVSGAGADSGGNVTFVTAPGSTDTVVIQRKLDLTQGTDYVANDPFPAESHEDALDRLTFITQQIQEEVDRSIKASVTNTISSTDFAISASDRANKIFAFDASGDLAVTQEIGTFRGNWAASTDYEQRDLVKDTSTNNIFIVNTAHTSSGAQPLTTNANSAKYDLIVDAASATTSATTATTQATAAATSATAAATSATNAATSESNASTSETNAATSATSAATSATNAGTSATAAAASETAAAASETAAAASETAAAASQTAAAASQSAAATSESNASTSASTATTKASQAATSATNAATSETNAAASATTATTKASDASTSATNAASSATAAAASQTAAAASAASAASAFDNFDDTYLGSKTSNPTTDNDGDPLTSGDLYFNSTANEMRVYDGANWIAATSAGNVSLILYEYTATSGQTTFSGSDDNSASLSYTVDNLQVVMNGVILDPADYTATNGTSVVLASGAAANDLVNIYAFKSFTTADMVSKTNGGTFSGAVTVPQLNADNLRLDGNTISSTDTNGNINLSPDGTGEVLVSTELGVALPSGQAAESNLHVIGDTAGLNASDIARFEGNNDGGNRGLRISQVASGGNQAAIDLQGYHSQSDANAWNIHMQTGGGNVAIGQADTNTVPSALTMGSGKNIRMLGSDARIEFFNSAAQYNLGVSGGAGIRFRNQGAGEEIGFETHHGGVQHVEAMNIDTKGLVKMPYQPLFAVTGPPSNNTYNTSPVTNYFTAVRYNVGGHYHTSGTNGGKFITPVAGVYLFEFGMFVNAANTFRLELKVNGVTVTNPYITGHNASMGTGYPVPAGHQILKLAAGDSVQWGVNGTAYLYGGHTGFAGYFLG